MLNGRFLKNKIDRQIKYNGSEFTFRRNKLDEYGQMTGEKDIIKVIKGVFHQEKVRVSLNEDNAARVVDVPKTYILCLYEDGYDLSNDDEVTISELNYRVIDKVNVGSLDSIFEVSLELMKDGEQY